MTGHPEKSEVIKFKLRTYERIVLSVGTFFFKPLNGFQRCIHYQKALFVGFRLVIRKRCRERYSQQQKNRNVKKQKALNAKRLQNLPIGYSSSSLGVSRPPLAETAQNRMDESICHNHQPRQADQDIRTAVLSSLDCTHAFPERAFFAGYYQLLNISMEIAPQSPLPTPACIKYSWITLRGGPLRHP